MQPRFFIEVLVLQSETAGARSDRRVHHFSDDLEKMIESPEK